MSAFTSTKNSIIFTRKANGLESFSIFSQEILESRCINLLPFIAFRKFINSTIFFPEPFSRNSLQFSPFSKECFGRIKATSKTTEFLKCACYSTNNSIRKSIKCNKFDQSLAAMLVDKQKKSVVIHSQYDGYDVKCKPRETRWMKVAKQNNCLRTSSV